MTNYVIYTQHPQAGIGGSGLVAPALSGLTLDDTVTGTGASKSILDEYVGSSNLIKVQKWLADAQRGDAFGRSWVASSDAGATFIKPLL